VTRIEATPNGNPAEWQDEMVSARDGLCLTQTLTVLEVIKIRKM
jgi:hypothetical protein